MTHAWWEAEEYDPENKYSTDFIQFLARETRATHIREFQNYVIPGLLQTPEYARAIMKSHWQNASEERVNAAINLRGKRGLLALARDCELDFIISEYAIKRTVDRQVKRTQLFRLAQLINDNANVTIRIIPDHALSNVRISSFELITEPFGESVVIETTAHDYYDFTPSVIAYYTGAFETLTAASLDREESIDFLFWITEGNE